MVSKDPANIGGLLVLGASGRLGWLLRASWAPLSKVVWHSRAGGPGYTAFDFLRDPKAFVQAARGARAVICLSGVTPRCAAQSGASVALNVDLALAAVRGLGLELVA